MDRPNDIGWKQFFISIVEMLRWPAAFIAVVLILRLPVERLLDAIATALRT